MSKYIEREALIAKMRTMPIPKQAGSGYTWIDNCAAGINSAIREVKSFPAADVSPVWISVNDRLPEPDDLVLVIVSGKPNNNITLYEACELAEYDADGWILEMYPEWMDAVVTHWMPLPEPPRRNGNGA